MTSLGHELRLFMRQRLAGPTLALLAVLSAVSVGAGLLEIRRQTEAIIRIQPLQAAEEADVAAWVSRDGDSGNAAYYTPSMRPGTDPPPSPSPPSGSATWRPMC